MHTMYSYLHSIKMWLPAVRRLTPKGPQSLWNVSEAEVGLSLHDEPALALILYPVFPFLIRSLSSFPSPHLSLSNVRRQ